MNRIWIFIVAITLLSCNTEAEKVDYIVLSGKITNPSEKGYPVDGTIQPFSINLSLDKEGNFRDTIKTIEQNITLYGGRRNRAFLKFKPGDDVYITADGNDFLKTLKLTGKGADRNNYFTKRKNLNNEENSDYKGKYSKNEIDFLAYIKDYEKKNIDLIENSPGLTKQEVESAKKNNYYMYLLDRYNYEAYHKKFDKNPDFKLSEHFLDEFKNVSLNIEEDFNEDILFYSYFISVYIRNEFLKQPESSEGDYFVSLLNYIDKKITNQKIKNAIIFRNGTVAISNSTEIEEVYRILSKSLTDEASLSEITKVYDKLKLLAKGQPSPKFINFENHAGGTTSLDDLKGKFVYIDVWATWCGPCKAEIPFLKEVEKKYHNKNIEFVSLSVDTKKDYNKWKKMVVDLDLGGTQLIADKDFKSQFIVDYQISGIPRFILIDPSGNIVSANAPRPSDKKLIELFSEYEI